MRTVTIKRWPTSSSGTFGDLDTGSFQCKTLERTKDIEHPCIPAGEYDVVWTTCHPHHNPCYEITNVPGMTDILIHSANWYQELLGCVSLGSTVEVVCGKLPDGTPINQIGVTASKMTLNALIADLKMEPFKLTITEGE